MATGAGGRLLPGVAVEGQVVRSVVDGILLDEGHVWKAVSVEASRLSALRETQKRPDSGAFCNKAPLLTAAAALDAQR